jgi:hypothetical protein
MAQGTPVFPALNAGAILALDSPATADCVLLERLSAFVIRH